MSATKAQKKAQRLQVFQEWKDRLNEVRVVVDGQHDLGYANGQNDHRFRFERGSPVVAFAKGIFYEAKVVQPCGAISFANPTVELKREDLASPTVPTYLVHYVGWPDKLNAEHAENKLVSRCAETVADAHGMMFAHEWNTELRMEKGLERIKVGKGAWFLQDDKYADLDAAWQTAAVVQVSFKEYSGGQRAEAALVQLE